MNTIGRLVYRNLRANLDKASLFFELVFPLFFIVQGYAVGSIVPPFELEGGKQITYPLFLAAGAVTLTVINGGTNAGTQLWFDRKNGMFEQILMGPFNRAQYIFSIILATLIIGIAGSLIVFVFVLPVLGAGLSLTFGGALLVAAALFLGTMFFGGFAITLSVLLRSSETFQIVSTFVFFVFLFTSSVFYPITPKTPYAIQVISSGNPLTYTTDLFRAGLFGLPTPGLEILTLGVEAAGIFVVAVVMFRRIRV
jgi:ABC-2 type transport system permease protein